MKPSEETKIKISIGRKKWLSENQDKHPWKKNSKFKSVPCEKVKEYLREKDISFVEEYQPLDDRFFSIDIAFPDIKMGIEINGNQHYNSDGSLKEYYVKRHKLIEDTGWVLLELHYSIAFKLYELENIIKFKKNVDYSSYITEQKERKNKKKIEQEQKKEQREKLKSEFINNRIEALLNSNIDFSKWGWVNKASEIMNIKPQKVNGWMEKYMKHFYLTKCFHRKTH